MPILNILILGGRAGTVAAVHLDGIANMSVLTPSREPYVYDLGPANALIDAAVLRLTGGREGYDKCSGYAVQGRVDEGLLTALLAEPHYAMSYSKSTGKEHFHDGYLEDHLRERPGIDGLDVTTVTKLTARVVGGELRRCGADEAIASGGGVANPDLMRRLAAAAP